MLNKNGKFGTSHCERLQDVAHDSKLSMERSIFEALAVILRVAPHLLFVRSTIERRNCDSQDSPTQRWHSSTVLLRTPSIDTLRSLTESVPATLIARCNSLVATRSVTTE